MLNVNKFEISQTPESGFVRSIIVENPNGTQKVVPREDNSIPNGYTTVWVKPHNPCGHTAMRFNVKRGRFDTAAQVVAYIMHGYGTAFLNRLFTGTRGFSVVNPPSDDRVTEFEYVKDNPDFETAEEFVNAVETTSRPVGVGMIQ